MEAKVLNSGRVMDHIIRALEQKKPLSVISVGATESYAMAQYRILSEEEFMNHKEAIVTNSGVKLRGFTFPNVALRNDLVAAVKQADIVGYNIQLRNSMKAGKMTELVFKTYGIQPKYVYDSLIRRVVMFSQRPKFKDMMRGRKVVLIGNTSKAARNEMNRRWKHKLHFEIVASVPIKSYSEIGNVKRTLDKLDYDLCLLSAGVNAIVLAPYISRVHGKVAFDIGQGMTSLATKEVVETGFIRKVGLSKLMKM